MSLPSPPLIVIFWPTRLSLLASQRIVAVLEVDDQIAVEADQLVQVHAGGLEILVEFVVAAVGDRRPVVVVLRRSRVGPVARQSTFR